MAPTPTITPVEPSITVDTFTACSDAVQAAALHTTRLAATSLPSDLPFHRSIDTALASDVDAFSARILGLTSKLVLLASGKTGRLQDEEDIVDKFVRNIGDSMEGILEGTDSALDVFLGRKKDPVISVPVVAIDPRQNTKLKKHQQPRGRLDPALTHASHLPKPQLRFKHTPSNTDESPYIPASLIPHKWCAKVPLGYVFHDEQPMKDAEDNRNEDVEDEERTRRMIHPYYYELTHPSYPNHVFNPPSNPLHPSSLEISVSSPASVSTSLASSSHPLTFVSTPRDLLVLANTISTVTELAIDLEHHSYRSYRGFLALMQISTREADFVVDLLVPDVREGLRQGKAKSTGKSEEERMAREAGQIIARVFADPSVIKVFHGAESDIVWLQQDFNIFVVGLFDTFHASKLLEFPRHSLANLLETFCDFIPDKRYQLADWRIRPLPVEMLTYARSDTHFLLYIYDKLRLSLVERASTSSFPSSMSDATLVTNTTQANPAHALIHTTLTRSSRTALRLHEVEVYDADRGTGPGGWDTLARKWNKARLVAGGRQELEAEMHGVPMTQGAVYRAVHAWREAVAKEEDESTRYVLPTHHLFLLAERMPITVPELLSLFGGHGGVSGGVPPVLRRRAGELVGVVRSAMQAATSKSGEEASGRGGSEEKEMGMSVAVTEDFPMVGTTTTAVESTNDSRLWAVPTSSPASVSAVTSHSSLFGFGIATQQSHAQVAAPPWGTVAPSPSGTTKSTVMRARMPNTSAERFQDLVERIHKTLVIAPVTSTPAVPVKSRESTQLSISIDASMHNSSSTIPHVSIPTSPSPAAPIEIPFVPAHQRQSQTNSLIYAPLEDDTIIVVGQGGARQRKRKREKTRGAGKMTLLKSGTSSGGAAESEASTGSLEEMDEFDYSKVSNLLDGDGKEDAKLGGAGERKKKKQRQVRGSGLFEYGNFRAPPRDQREVKSGNKTHTFR
ncbi:hypothetical protein PAXRUDRAFT_35796 [Paxillus rubicundulus Ve08.2h10]|uniref:HRDC domain-containing protein n=1 Tax=Paxillus rubicundulus Ve08.2h10 TaxID=930991 RepID=A0A0D0DC32_9AGAM|nr:hypothetical protein PAXRUDRAFT_35796 [Paxillus rubicundulus Ve08.2h10]